MDTKEREFYDGEGVLLSLGISDVHVAGGESPEDDRPKWIHIAKQGAFAGHPRGPFKIDLKTFEEIITNFKATQNRRIPWDFEHASEQDPTSGSIPERGAPAQGWITDLKIEGGNLYGLTEWGELARQYVREKKYRYCSPAIRFTSNDRVTGKPIGARLTSVALTNEPFLDGLAPLAAKDQQHAAPPKPIDTTPPAKMNLKAYRADLHKALEGHAPKGDACGGVHYAAHALLRCLDDAPADGESAAMKFRDSEGRAAAAEFKLRDVEARYSAIEAEVVALRADHASREDAELRRLVDEAFATHKDTRKLTDADRPRLMALARAGKEHLFGLFPPLPSTQQYLMREITPKEPTRQADVDASPLSQFALARKLVAERRLSLSDAQIEASRIINARSAARAEPGEPFGEEP